MHISTGKFEGKKIKDSHEGYAFSCRTLTVKESIFEIIGIRIDNARVLDINDKNGMYGIEALSKGAASVHFLNKDKKKKSLVKENLLALEIDPKNHILEIDLRDFFAQKTDVRYDIIFFRAIDAECLSMSNRVLEFLSDTGIAIFYYPDIFGFDLGEVPDGYQVVESRSIESDKCLVILRKLKS